MLKIPASLRTTADINGYSDAAQARKNAMHKDGAKFLKELAGALGLSKPEYSIRSNVAGIAVSGEVTLHADHLYVQLGESMFKPGLQLLYRSCKNQKDYTGGQNNFIQMSELVDSERQAKYVRACASLMARAAAQV